MVAGTKGIVKKESKKERAIRIYAEYGIEFDGKNILAPEFGFISPLLIDGNLKIGNGVYHFSTLPTNRIYTVVINGKEYSEKGTCPITCQGKDKNGNTVDTCYGTKGRYAIEGGTVQQSLLKKTYLIRNHLDFVYRAISAQLKVDNITVLRVHATGDFDSAAYIDMWKRIAIENSNVTMWTYTKVKDAESAFDDISNFNVVKSAIAGKGFNYGHCDYIISLYEYLKSLDLPVFICRCGVDKEQHCNECNKCATNKFVLFLEHSTDYNPKKDPLYPAFVALVNSQKFEKVNMLQAAN